MRWKWGIFELHGFFCYNFPCMNFFRTYHEYFLGLIGVHEFFSFNFPLRNFFFCTSPTPAPPPREYISFCTSPAPTPLSFLMAPPLDPSVAQAMNFLSQNHCRKFSRFLTLIAFWLISIWPTLTAKQCCDGERARESIKRGQLLPPLSPSIIRFTGTTFSLPSQLPTVVLNSLTALLVDAFWSGVEINHIKLGF